jgi:hypothetical protein
MKISGRRAIMPTPFKQTLGHSGAGPVGAAAYTRLRGDRLAG